MNDLEYKMRKLIVDTLYERFNSSLYSEAEMRIVREVAKQAMPDKDMQDRYTADTIRKHSI